jgi:nucleoside 2-deoxyribosyltransferase
MKDIYLTSTFTNQWNVEFNHKIGDALEKKGITCYLPHRDTNQKSGDRLEIFTQDIEGINVSSIVLAIASNESPNWGAELGYAYGIKKPILAIFGKEHTIPLICNGMVTDVLEVNDMNIIDEYIDLLIERIQKILNNNKIFR